MNIIPIIFNVALLLCVAYASILGGKTGRSGSLIFVAATILTITANRASPTWADTAYGILLVDFGCMMALVVVAFKSDRFWPIWALGFQTGAVGTHIATMWMPEIVPRAYQALAALWSIPILWVMVAGTWRDRRYEMGIRKSSARTG